MNFGSGTLAQFTNLPTNASAGTIGSGLSAILPGALYNNADFVAVAAGVNVAAATYDSQDDASLWGVTAGHDGNIASAILSGATGSGTIVINALKNTGGGTLTIGAAATDVLSIKSGMVLTTGTPTINGPGKITSGNGADLIVYNTNALTIDAPITGSIGLTKAGNGTLNLTGTGNDFTGNILVTQGSVNFAPASGTATYANTLASSTAVTKSGAGTVAFSGPVNINAGTGTVLTVNGGTLSFSGSPVSISGALNVNAGGTLALSSSSFTTTGRITVGATAGTSPAIMTQTAGTLVGNNGLPVGNSGAGDGGAFAGHQLSISGGSFTHQRWKLPRSRSSQFDGHPEHQRDRRRQGAGKQRPHGHGLGRQREGLLQLVRRHPHRNLLRLGLGHEQQRRCLPERRNLQRSEPTCPGRGPHLWHHPSRN